MQNGKKGIQNFIRSKKKSARQNCSSNLHSKIIIQNRFTANSARYLHKQIMISQIFYQIIITPYKQCKKKIKYSNEATEATVKSRIYWCVDPNNFSIWIAQAFNSPFLATNHKDGRFFGFSFAQCSRKNLKFLSWYQMVRSISHTRLINAKWTSDGNL